MGISSVDSFPVQSGGSLIFFFQLFRCRNLALNRVFAYFLVADMFYTWGVSGPPTFVQPPYICMPPYIHTPPGMYTPPYAPILFYASVCFWRLCMLWGVVMGSPLCWDTLPYITLVWWCIPFDYTPHTQSLVPCTWVCFRDISMLCGHFPSVRKGLGVFPPSVEGGRHQHLRCPYAHSCTFFVVHYVSHFDYGSDYYSSSYTGIF